MCNTLKNSSKLDQTAISQTIIEVEIPKKWACQICTYENHLATIKCAICGHKNDKNVDQAEGDKDKNHKNKGNTIQDKNFVTVNNNTPSVPEIITIENQPSDTDQNSEISENDDQNAASPATIMCTSIQSLGAVSSGTVSPIPKQLQNRMNSALAANQKEKQTNITSCNDSSDYSMHSPYTNHISQMQMMNQIHVEAYDRIQNNNRGISNSANESENDDRSSKNGFDSDTSSKSLKEQNKNRVRSERMKANSAKKSRSDEEITSDNSQKENNRIMSKIEYNHTQAEFTRPASQESNTHSIDSDTTSKVQIDDTDTTGNNTKQISSPVLNKCEWSCPRCTFFNSHIMTKAFRNASLIKEDQPNNSGNFGTDQSNVQSGSGVNNENQKNNNQLNHPILTIENLHAFMVGGKDLDLTSSYTSSNGNMESSFSILEESCQRYRILCEMCRCSMILVIFLKGPSKGLNRMCPEYLTDVDYQDQKPVFLEKTIVPLTLLDICKEIINPSTENILSQIPLNIELIFTPLSDEIITTLETFQSGKNVKRMNKTLFHLAIYNKRLPILHTIENELKTAIEATKQGLKSNEISEGDNQILSQGESNSRNKTNCSPSSQVTTHELLNILTEYRQILRKVIHRLTNHGSQDINMKKKQNTSNKEKLLNSIDAIKDINSVADFSPLRNSSRYVQNLKIFIYSQFRTVKARFTTENSNNPVHTVQIVPPLSNNRITSLAAINQSHITPAQGLWYVNDISRIFTLPNNGLISTDPELQQRINHKIFKNIIDFNVQKILQENRVINYLSHVLPNSRLIALRNRSQGDCLLDALMQCVYGCYDDTQILRNALLGRVD